MIFYIATIAAVLLTGVFCFATEVHDRWKGIVSLLVVLSLVFQFGMNPAWGLATAMVIQALVSVGIAFYLKFRFL